MDHDKKSAGPHLKSNPDLVLFGIMDNYKTSGYKRMNRNQLRTIYALVQYQAGRERYDTGEMQEAVRKWTGDNELDLEELLLRFQNPEDKLTTAVRHSLEDLSLKENVQALWEDIKAV